MFTINFEPSTLHQLFWNKWLDPRVKMCFSHKPDFALQLTTVQLIHDALERLFMSVEEKPGVCFEEHILMLEPNIKRMYLTGLECGLIHGKAIHTIEREKVEVDSLTNRTRKSFHVVDVESLPSDVEIIWSLLGEAFDNMVCWLDDMLCRVHRERGWGEVNYYSVIDLSPVVKRNGQVTMLRLELGDDIRHIFFREVFSGGRYSSNYRLVRDS